jgi:hypothetical protein
MVSNGNEKINVWFLLIMSFVMCFIPYTYIEVVQMVNGL